MNKKLIITLLVAVGVIAAAAGLFLFVRNGQTNTNNNNNNQTATNKEKKMGKTLVVYYSAQNHTKSVATKIAANLGADTFEITPEKAYTETDLNWNDSNSRVSREHNDASLRNVTLKSTDVPNWDTYDTVIIGYPIWWGIAAWPTNAFVKAVDFGTKTVIPFCTSYSSELGESVTLLKNDAKGGSWQSGHRFSQNTSDSDVKSWTDNL